jgi:hypothetical protein
LQEKEENSTPGGLGDRRDWILKERQDPDERSSKLDKLERNWTTERI